MNTSALSKRPRGTGRRYLYRAMCGARALLRAIATAKKKKKIEIPSEAAEVSIALAIDEEGENSSKAGAAV